MKPKKGHDLITLTRGADGWRWRRAAANNEIVGASTEAYENKAGVVANAERINNHGQPLPWRGIYATIPVRGVVHGTRALTSALVFLLLAAFVAGVLFGYGLGYDHSHWRRSTPVTSTTTTTHPAVLGTTRTCDTATCVERDGEGNEVREFPNTGPATSTTDVDHPHTTFARTP